MDTIVIQLEASEKSKALIEFLKSLDYVYSIERQEHLKKARLIFDRLNAEATKSEIAEMSEDEINDLINEAKREYPHSH